MTIKATFDGKTFVPQGPVTLPVGFELQIAVPETTGESTQAPPLAELLKLVDQWPVNSDWPEDGAAQHDHYLYGTPKRS